jgi:hypothetical protein
MIGLMGLKDTRKLAGVTKADLVLDQSAHLLSFSFSANHNAGNEKFTSRRARKYCRLLGLP